MAILQQCIKQLSEGKNLTSEQTEQALTLILDGQASPSTISAFLMGLRVKGETVPELLGCAKVLRSHRLIVEPQAKELVDTCGTGGDGSHSINISTIASLLVASCGVPVAKHGNRSVSSKCGSGDLLEALGIPLLKDPQEVAQQIDQIGYGFLFAPHFHPSLHHVTPIRRELKIRTIFNLMGPLANPANAPYQVLGVFSPRWVEPIAQLTAKIGLKRVLVVHGEGGIDELTLYGENRVALMQDGQVETFTFKAQDHKLPPCQPSDLDGGDPQFNAAIAEKILLGERSPRADTVYLNAGAALYVGGRADSIAEGFEFVAQKVREGKPKELLERLRNS